MDRQLVYAGQIPLETDLLNTNKNAMIGMAKLAAAVLGTATQYNGLSVGPTSPASLQVQVGAGEIYSLMNVDGTAYSSLAADTTHQILKQGILLDAINLTCAAPATVGQSINYLIQATLQESDSGSTLLPYYNSSNPSSAWSGPLNAGSAQNTQRKCICVVSAKAGTPATTGSQTTPSPDSGYVGIGVVTVAYGQTTIASGSISAYASAPSITSLASKLSNATGVWLTDAAGGQRLYFDTATTYLKGTGTSPVVLVGPGGNLTLNSDGTVSAAADAATSGELTRLGQIATLIAAQFNGSNQSLPTSSYSTSSWYQKLPGGLILQGGYANAGGTPTITFPVAFPHGCMFVGATDTGASNYAYAGSSVGSTSFVLSGAGYARWIAVGW